VEIKHKQTGEVLRKITGESLAGVDLQEALLRYADLRGADLTGARLRMVDLCSADLSGALLCGADLRAANLNGADLSGADLREAIIGSEHSLERRRPWQDATSAGPIWNTRICVRSTSTSRIWKMPI